MSILSSIQKEPVVFDPNNREHVEAYSMLHYQGRQHPHLRFFLDDNYLSVYHMMASRITEAWITHIDKENMSKIAKERIGPKVLIGKSLGGVSFATSSLRQL